MIRTRKIFLINVSDIWFDIPSFNNSKTLISVLHTNEKIDEKLFSFKIEEKTLFIDLKKNIDDIYSAFDAKSARYPIRKAEKEGVVVSKAETEAEINTFYTFFASFALRKEFPSIKREELNDLDVFYAVSSEKEFLGGIACMKSGNKSIYRYKYGATIRKHNENDLLIFHAIKYAKEHGYGLFDFGGVRLIEDVNNYHYHHYKFKEKFGGFLGNFFTYIKVKRPLSFFMLFPNMIVYLFFKNNYHDFIYFLNKVNIFSANVKHNE